MNGLKSRPNWYTALFRIVIHYINMTYFVYVYKTNALCAQVYTEYIIVETLLLEHYSVSSFVHEIANS